MELFPILVIMEKLVIAILACVFIRQLLFHKFIWHFLQVVLEKLLNDSEEVVEGDDMIDFEALLGDDTFMSTAT